MVHLPGRRDVFAWSGSLGEFFFDRFRWFVGENLKAGQAQCFLDQNGIFSAEYVARQLFPAARRVNFGGLLNKLLAELEVGHVTTVKRQAVR